MTTLSDTLSFNKELIMKVVFTYGGPNPYRPKAKALISLARYNNGKFVVTYGDQVSERLSYYEASQELGGCLMHHLASEGLLDS